MEFLRNERRFDFVYGGVPFAALDCKAEQTESGNVLTTVYTLADGLRITNVAIKHEGAYEWVNWLENTAAHPSEVISELCDASLALALPHEEPLGWTAFQPDFHAVTAVYSPSGSTWGFDEFCSFADRSDNNAFIGHLPPEKSKCYAASGGRSSEQKAPFFNVHKDGCGYVFAIGWTGQWNCFLERTPDALIVKTKIEDTFFRLLPGEKMRTSSFVLMPYEGTVLESQNKWRRLIKRSFSLIGAKGRDSHGPLCAGVWGGMKTSSVLARIEAIKENGLPFEYVWMDAGWYGEQTDPSPDEFEGDWGSRTGDWRVSPRIHPGGLKDVSQAAKDAGMKFLLWFEPERVIRGTPITQTHPEYFLPPADAREGSLLLDLGNCEAWDYCFKTIVEQIESIGVDCYRQDFNMSPLPYWRKNDAADRRGISEIKHIMGLYRLWDALLARFPHLLIDNCASGGRRIDIETLRRSIPLWRSDYQCPANYLPEGGQCHNISFSTWMPYSGTGSGRMYDTYRMRSAYSPALTTNYTYSEREPFGEDEEKLRWLKARLEEYLQLRPYLSADFYPLTEISDRRDVWCATQFDRPEEGDGMIQIFRRENSPYGAATFDLHGIDPDGEYVFTDMDSHAVVTAGGKELQEKGLAVEMREKYSSKILLYKKR